MKSTILKTIFIVTMAAWILICEVHIYKQRQIINKYKSITETSTRIMLEQDALLDQYEASVKRANEVIARYIELNK